MKGRAGPSPGSATVGTKAAWEDGSLIQHGLQHEETTSTSRTDSFGILSSEKRWAAVHMSYCPKFLVSEKDLHLNTRTLLGPII